MKQFIIVWTLIQSTTVAVYSLKYDLTIPIFRLLYNLKFRFETNLINDNILFSNVKSFIKQYIEKRKVSIWWLKYSLLLLLYKYFQEYSLESQIFKKKKVHENILNQWLNNENNNKMIYIIMLQEYNLYIKEKKKFFF